MTAIVGYHRYTPAKLAWDEDPLTMMLETARPLLAEGGMPDRLAIASQSLPYARRVQAGMISTALGMPAQTFCLECTTSARAATEAVRALGTGLVLAADGAFAAGLLLGDGDGAARILEARSALAEYPGLQFTPAGETEVWDVQVPDYAEFAYLDLISRAAQGLEADLLALNPPHPRLGNAAARRLGFGKATLAPEGSGAAGPLLALIAALEQAAPGQRILLVSYGAGSTADALLVEKGGA